jgi:hypothetical protein
MQRINAALRIVFGSHCDGASTHSVVMLLSLHVAITVADLLLLQQLLLGTHLA